MMNEQEMQFADPDWQPQGSLPRPQEKTAAGPPLARPVTSNIPYDTNQDASPLSYEQGYRVSPHRQSIPYVSPVAQQVGGTRRRSFWWVWVVVIIIVISMFSGMSRSFNRGTGFSAFQKPRPAQVSSNSLNNASQLSIIDQNGSVTVHVANTNVPQILVQPSDDTSPYISYAGDRMTVTIDNSAGVIVTVPRDVALSLQIEADSVEVDGFTGQISAQTDSGSITLNQDVLNGQSNVTSQNGDIILNQDTLNGNATIQTGGAGNINFTGTLEATGIYQFLTDSGDITLNLPSNSALRVSPIQNSGTYQSDFANSTGSEPQAVVTVSTGSGHISIHQN
jgi:hypothetical protein